MGDLGSVVNWFLEDGFGLMIIFDFVVIIIVFIIFWFFFS